MDDIAPDQQNIDNYSESGNAVVITQDQMIQLNDPQCEHEWVRDPSEETDSFYGEQCKHCIIGRLIKK